MAPTFKGNAGNLMQHWVLCEIVTVIGEHADRLLFVDAHAMAPVAHERKTKNVKFDAAQKRLSERRSTYEHAWHALASRSGGYPNSANFATHLWPRPGDCSMLLCERDESTCQELRCWAAAKDGFRIETSLGDWRERFKCGLPAHNSLMFASFDPDMISRHNAKKKCPRRMYMCDLDSATSAICACSSDAIVQLSTYTANGGNKQDDVLNSIRPRLKKAGFNEIAVVAPKVK